MDLLMDGLLAAATLFAGCYCWILSGRVKDLKSLDKGLGGSIVNMTRQIELARKTLEEARGATNERHDELASLVAEASAVSDQLKTEIGEAKRAEHSARIERELLAEAMVPLPQPEETETQGPEETSADLSPLTERQLSSLADLAGKSASRDDQSGRAATISELPKPRALSEFSNPLRPRNQEAPARNEDELVEALAQMAAGAGK